MFWWHTNCKKNPQAALLSCFQVFENVPLCLSRKPKRAESEISSLPEAGPAVLSFERQHGKINRHLLREPMVHTVLLPHGQTALGPVVCCCCCCCWVSLHCLLWEDFQPCAATKISALSLFVFLFIFPSHPISFPLFSSFWSLVWTEFLLCSKAATPSQTSLTSLSVTLIDNNCKLAVCITWCECGGWCDPQLCEHLYRWERREDFLRCCVYISSLAAPWIPVRQCQGRTTS